MLQLRERRAVVLQCNSWLRQLVWWMLLYVGQICSCCVGKLLRMGHCSYCVSMLLCVG